MSKRQVMFGIGWGAVIVVLFLVCKYGHPTRSNSRREMTNTSLVQKQALAALSVKSASTADFSHLGSDVLPPTNSWLSGMVLHKKPFAVYPLPLSFLAKESGFEVGLPTITTSAQTISGGHVAGIQAGIKDADSFMLQRYDKVSATLRYRTADAKPIADVTLAEGSPFVFLLAKIDTTIILRGIHKSVPNKFERDYLRYSSGGHDYAVVARHGASISWSGSDAAITAKKGSEVTFYSLPSNSSPDVLRRYAGNVLESVATNYSERGSNYVTTFSYKTANGQPTVFIPMHYQTIDKRPAEIQLRYESIYGQMHAYEGESISISSPAITPSNKLELSKLSNDQKAQLTTALRSDISNTVIDKTDSYYAGKQLGRAANLLEVAEQLGEKDLATQIKTKITDAFAQRLGGDYFYYDKDLRGVAAKTNAFGSEDFNDHNFHYGYFLYAASILGEYDSSFVSKYKSQINLLAADIANYDASSTSFPLQRYFDPYVGHSWAAGLAPFGDGNNLESSSEAINAWNGVALWGRLTDNQELEEGGEWMLANEWAAARAAWRDVHIQGYTSPVVDINFGGKRVYSTFFSDNPGTKLGIQLIPLSPVMTDFANDTDIANRVGASIQNDNFNVPLGDYALMYLALSDPAKAQALAAKQQVTFIDDGNSRTYFQAWIYSVSR